MEYASFEEGLKALASNDTMNRIFGPLEVGLSGTLGSQLPYITLNGHALHLNANEARELEHIVIDFEKSGHANSKQSMRIEFIKHGDQWRISESNALPCMLNSQPQYDEGKPLWISSEDPKISDDVSFQLRNWRVSRLEVMRDHNSMGTVLPGERVYCGPNAMKNVGFLGVSARE